jgi:nicotinate phosphoribosyltransferase
MNGIPKMKISENIEKITLPGKKKLIRFFDNEGKFYRDAILLEGENPEETDVIYHPVHPEKNTSVKGLKFEPLLFPVFSNGKISLEKQTIPEINSYLAERAKLFPDEHKRFISPHIYKTGISKKLMQTRETLEKQLKTKMD